MSLLYWLLGLRAPFSVVRILKWELAPADPMPAALLVLLGIAAVALAGLNLLPHLVLPWRLRLGLAAIRLAAFGVLLLLLVRLELLLEVEREEPPRLAVLTDTSGSMGLRDAGAPDGEPRTRLAAAADFYQRRLAPLSGRVRFSRYAVDWRLRPAGGEAAEASGTTRLMRGLEELLQREGAPQGVVLLTDGNDTAGDRGELVLPLLQARGVPVYPVVFGSPQAPRRGQVRVTGGNTYVRLGDELVLGARLEANLQEERTVRVSLFREGEPKPLSVRENIRLGAEPRFVRFTVRPERAGTVIYRIVMEGLTDVVSEKRLAAEHRVEVIDQRIRVLYLDIPRDERKLLGHWLARDPVVDLGLLTRMPKGGWYGQGALQHENAGEGLPSREADLFKYDVVIFGDIPRSYFRAGGDTAETKMRWLAEFVARRGGGLITLGGKEVYSAGGYEGSVLAQVLPFAIRRVEKPQVGKRFPLTPTGLGLAHPLMQLEPEPARNREAWYDLPQLEGCNRVGPVRPSATLLAVRLQEEERLPVMAVHNVGKGRVLSLAVDTTWHWQMQRPPESPDRYRRFWGNAVRHLAPDPRLAPHRPQIRRSRSAAAVGETVELSTRLVNNVFEPIRGADLRIEVRAPDGEVFHIHPRDGRSHPGVYPYRITLDEGGAWSVRAEYQDKVTEDVLRAGESDEELDDPRARPAEMSVFAEATGGEAFEPGAADDLLTALNLAPRRSRTRHVVALWNLPLALLLFIALVGLDCYLRKRRGLV